MNHLGAIIEASKDSDITLVGYDETGRSTLPPIQRELETIGGGYYQEELDLPIRDSWRGPRVYSAAAVEVLADYENEPGMQWGHLWGVPLTARNAGLTLGGVELPMRHPPEITAYESGPGRELFDRKRISQFVPQMTALRGLFRDIMSRGRTASEETVS